MATLTFDGKEVESTEFPRTIAFRMSLDETLDIGEDTGTPISEDHAVPFKFTGDLESVTISITEKELTPEQLRKYREGRLEPHRMRKIPELRLALPGGGPPDHSAGRRQLHLGKSTWICSSGIGALFRLRRPWLVLISNVANPLIYEADFQRPLLTVVLPVTLPCGK